MTTQKQIQPNSEVLAHITIKLKDGTVADSTKVNAEPSLMRLGDASLSDAIEQQLLGLRPGDQKKFDVTPEQGFGLPNPANIHQVARTSFSENIKLQVGVIVEFEQINGQKVPGTIREVNDETVTVDFNHPLCGQQLFFEIDIIDIL